MERVTWPAIGVLLFATLLACMIPYHGAYSIVTGANGYVGRVLCHELLLNKKQSKIYCLVRDEKLAVEQAYWDSKDGTADFVVVLPYDMLDGGSSVRQAIATIVAAEDTKTIPSIDVYHVASAFGPTDNHTQTALDNVRGTVDLIETMAAASKEAQCRLLLTSSMAAVRGPGQPPSSGSVYTHEDWNTVSQLGTASWGASYQWSKTEAERQAWDLCQRYDIPMTSICPAFVFGPPATRDSSSYAVHMVRDWLLGRAPVQSRLLVDVRDVAKAHVLAAAAQKTNLVGHRRYIVARERRVPGAKLAEWLQQVRDDSGRTFAHDIHYDATFTGGAIPIGDQEVEAENRLREELGLVLRPLQETVVEMAQVLLREEEDI